MSGYESDKIISSSPCLEKNQVAVTIRVTISTNSSRFVVSRQVIEVVIDDAHSSVHFCLRGLLAQHYAVVMIAASHEES